VVEGLDLPSLTGLGELWLLHPFHSLYRLGGGWEGWEFASHIQGGGVRVGPLGPMGHQL
jgi:hypothetical protein